APADDAEAVDHRRVRIGADECIRINGTVGIAEHALRQVLEIDLVDDADARRHNLERVERLHAPLEELVALAVALELELEIAHERLGRAGKIHLHGVVDDQVDRHERLDDLGILAEPINRRAHRGQIDEKWNAREVLQDNPRHDERDRLRPRRHRLRSRARPHGGLGDPLAVAMAQQRLEDEPDRHRQAIDRETGVLQRGKRIVGVGRAIRGESGAGVQRIGQTHRIRKDNWRAAGSPPAPNTHCASAALTFSKSGRSLGVGVCSAYFTLPSLPMTNAARAAVSPTPARFGKTTSYALVTVLFRSLTSVIWMLFALAQASCAKGLSTLMPMTFAPSCW